MKKVLVSMMLAGALIAGNTAIAQTTTDGSTGATVQKEKCENCTKGKEGKKCDKEGKKGNKGGKKGGKDFKGNKGTRQQFNPFDGVQLTPDQQQKLQVLQQGLGPVMLTPEQQANIPENKNLTPEQKKQLKEERRAKKQEAKKNYLKGVKETLTPEQYVIFLENCYLYAPQDQGVNKGNQHGKAPRQGERAGKEKREIKKQ